MLSSKIVELVPHDPRWAERAKSELVGISRILGECVVRSEHIGSTAIPGICAKPIIDLMPLVASISEIDPLQSRFEADGYRWWGEFGLPGRRYVTRDDLDSGKRITNVHIYAVDDPDVIRHLAFRDFLLAHPERASEYEARKLKCLAKLPKDVNEYNDCKNDWIKATETDAVAWWNARL